MLCEKDFIVLSHLRKNSRKSLVKISKQTGIPVTTVYDILKRLEKKNIIDKHTAIIDFKKAGFKIRVNLALKVNKKPELLDFLLKNENINSIHKVTDYDFFVDAIFLNLLDYKFFKKNIEKFDLIKIKEHHIIEDIKRENANIIY